MTIPFPPMPLDLKTGKPPNIRFVDMQGWYYNTPFDCDKDDISFYTSLLLNEPKRHINYMNMFGNQTPLTEISRAALVGWLGEVAYKMNVTNYVYYMAVDLLDRCTNDFNIKTNEYQLLGACCLHLICKMEELVPLDMSDLIWVSDGAFTSSDMKRMEIKIVKSQSNFLRPVPASLYLKRFVQILPPVGIQFSNLCYCMLRLCILSTTLMDLLPSQMAVGIFYAAHKLFFKAPIAWDDTFEYYTKMPRSVAEHCSAKIMSECIRVKGFSRDIVGHINKKFPVEWDLIVI